MAGEVFISYRRSDLAHAKRLHEFLKAEGVDAWYDAHVGAGQDWRQATATALSNSKVFVLLFSKAAAASEDIAKELAAATYSKKLVVPVRIENIQPEGAFLYELAAKNWIDAYDNTNEVLTDLAKNLAAVMKDGVVKDGVATDRVVQFQRNPKPGPKRVFGFPVWGIALAAVAALAAAGVSAIFRAGDNAARPVPGRIAFFGVDAPANDVDAEAMAATASSTILATFATLELDVAARADTVGTAPQQRLDRAKQVRAAYAISGSVIRSGDRLSISMLVEDTPTRTALWSDPLTDEGTTPTALASRAAALLTDKLACVISVRASLPADTMQIVSRLPRACESVRIAQSGHIDRWRELIALAPDSPWIRGSAAFAMFNAIPDAAPASVNELTRLAEESLRRGEDLDPKSPEVLRAKVAATRFHGGSLVEIEQSFLDGLELAPHGPNLLGGYGAFLLTLGRLQDAARYAREAIAADPLSAAKLLGVGQTLAHAGYASEAAELYDRMHTQFPGNAEWQTRVADALFRNIGDLDRILADPPLSMPAQTKTCLVDIVGLVRRKPSATRQAVERARGCMAGGAIDEQMGNHIRAFLGDYDGVFAVGENDPGWFFSNSLNPHRTFLFDPALAPLRADPRFMPMMEKAGIVQYWRESGHAPDFCKTEKAPVCVAIAQK